MSRTLSAIAMLLVCFVAYALYQLSYEVQRLEEELIELNRGLGRERETIGVLQAEWSYLTRPEYLQDMAQRLLEMKPASAKQIVPIDSLPWRQERVAPPVAAADPPVRETPAAPAAETAKAAEPETPAAPSLAAQSPAAPIQATRPAPAKSPAPKTEAELDADVAAVLASMRGRAQ